MKQPIRRTLAGFAGVLLLALTASATSEQQLLEDLQALEAEHESLESRIDACPGGNCSEAAQIESDLDGATADLAAAEAARDAIDPCSCAQIDALLDDIGTTNVLLRAEVEGWA